MTKFTDWLMDQSIEDQPPSLQTGLKKIQEFIGSEKPWPSASNDLASYVQFMADEVKDPGERELLLNSLSACFEKWNMSIANSASGGKFGNISAGAIALVVFGVVFALALIYALFFHRFEFIRLLAEADNARGLITFLFAFGAISIILLTAIAIFWIDKDSLDQRFRTAKDLITIIIGVLGTIVGFYYGSQSAQGEVSLFANLTTSAESLAPGETFKIIGTVSGGAPDYTIAVRFSADDLTIEVPETTSDDGKISIDVQVPAAINKPTLLPFAVQITDAEGANTAWSAAVLAIPP